MCSIRLRNRNGSRMNDKKEREKTKKFTIKTTRDLAEFLHRKGTSFGDTTTINHFKIMSRSLSSLGVMRVGKGKAGVKQFFLAFFCVQ